MAMLIRCQRLVFTATIAGLALVIAQVSTAATINVPADYATIQEAINDAGPGDDVLVAPGSYAENIDLLGKAITLHSSGGSNVTIINGAGLGPVITCATGEGHETVIDGFTVLGGSADNGAGMYNLQSSPTVMNCTFLGNVASINGGGMYNYQAAPTVSVCMFINNTAITLGPSGVGGGGMYNDESSPEVLDCQFVANLGDDNGSGMANVNSSSPTITGCSFLENGGSDGAAMYNNVNSNPTIEQCRFAGNRTASGIANAGGAILSNNDSSPTIRDSEFCGNKSLGEGGAIWSNGGTTTVERCTFTGNDALNDGGAIYCVGNVVLSMTDSVFCANLPDHLSGACSAGPGNVFYPPLCLGDADGDGDVDTDDFLAVLSNWGLCLIP